MKSKRTLIDKIKAFLFWEDTRITEGEPYTQVREHDFSSYYPKYDYVKKVPLPTENVTV